MSRQISMVKEEMVSVRLCRSINKFITYTTSAGSCDANASGITKAKANKLPSLTWRV